MSTSNVNAKVTLTDFFTVVCFVAPVAGGIAEGLKGGVVGVLAGFILGFTFGLLCAFGFRICCISIAGRVCFSAETPSAVWQVLMALLFLILEMAWVFSGSFLAQITIRYVVHHAAA